MHKTQVEILRHLKGKPNATYADIAKLLKVDLTGTVVHHVRQLISLGYLKRNNRWQLTKQAAKVLEGWDV